jgi:hypothetical protein
MPPQGKQGSRGEPHAQSHPRPAELSGRQPKAQAIVEDLRISKMSKAANFVEQSVHCRHAPPPCDRQANMFLYRLESGARALSTKPVPS